MKNTIKLQGIFQITGILRMAGALAALSAFALAGLASCIESYSGTVVVANAGAAVVILPENGNIDSVNNQGYTYIGMGESKKFAVHSDESPWFNIYIDRRFVRRVFVRNNETVTVDFGKRRDG